VANEARDVEQRTTHGSLTLLLRRERYCARPGESAGELGEDRQVGVKLDPLKTTDSKRPLVLEPTELPLDGATALVELPPVGRLTWDQRVKSIRGRSLLVPAPSDNASGGTVRVLLSHESDTLAVPSPDTRAAAATTRGSKHYETPLASLSSSDPSAIASDRTGWFSGRRRADPSSSCRPRGLTSARCVARRRPRIAGVT
jgi:hypothetical protein